uniref:Glycosyltransferase family 92 protein n=1 Tax=Parascaris equorum TaxID=6256 RepID=A0A914RPN5_PAREQ
METLKIRVQIIQESIYRDQRFILNDCARFYSTETIEWLDKSQVSAGRYFTDIVDMLISFGYRRRKTLFGAPYDWRKAPSYNMDHYRIILPPNRIRIMQRSFTSSSFLFPSYNLWNEDEVFATTPSKNYSIANVKEFFFDMKYTDGWSQYQNTAYLLGKLEAPNVEVHCIYGFEVPTPEKFEWPKGYFPDYQPTVIYGDGDGTVNYRSLDVCSRWIGRNGGKNVRFIMFQLEVDFTIKRVERRTIFRSFLCVTVHPLEKTNHLDVLKHVTSFDIIRKVVYGLPL